MIKKDLTVLCLALSGAWAGVALAQSADSVNPAVNTSASQADAPAAAAPVVAAPAPAPSSSVHTDAAPSLQSTGGAVAAAGAGTAGTTKPARPAAAASTAAPGQAAPAGSSDRIELGTSEISGNRELPKLMYIVPWQRAEVGKVTGRPPNSLVDEALTPVDRTVFERQNNYFAALQAASASAPSQPAAPGAPPAAAGPRDEK